MIKDLKEYKTNIHKSCFIVDDCTVLGRVTMGEKSNVWFGAIIRADVNEIHIGKYTNVQDGCIIHVTKFNKTVIGDYVSIGHGAKLHGCSIGNNVLIGIGSIILDGAVIGDNTIIGAGTLIPPGKQIPEGVLVVGNPYRIVRKVRDDEYKLFGERCMNYAEIYPKYYL